MSTEASPAATADALNAMNPGIASPPASPPTPAPVQPAPQQPVAQPIGNLAPAPQAAVAPPTPQAVTISMDQLQAFTAMQTRLTRIEEEQARTEQAKKHAEALILSQRGEHENALRMARETAEAALNAARAENTATQERAKRYALDGALAVALTGHSLVPGGAEQITRLIRDEFVVEPHGNSFNVRTQDFKSVGDYIASMLSQPTNQHWLLPKNPSGGVGVNQGTALAAPVTPPPTKPDHPLEASNLGQAIVFQAKYGDKPQGHVGAPMLMGGSSLAPDGSRVALPSPGIGGFASPSVMFRDAK